MTDRWQLEATPSFTLSQKSIIQGSLLAVKSTDYSQNIALEKKMLLFTPSNLDVNKYRTIRYLLHPQAKRQQCLTSLRMFLT